MYDDVLLPTDGSDGMTDAANHAGVLAERFDATVHILSVTDPRNRFESPTGGLSTAVWEEAERERAEQAVARTAATLPDGLDVETAVREGVPKTVILDYVRDGGMDMVVMGTHGRSGLDHYLIGSVAEKVVRNSPVPVVTVRLTGD